ncbi:hypothetical protein [Amycolatopsis circi]|uniref:hypothetical protein n=1 Tax=Amycolatopsis circi TaxID=871959 RepID=UPI000E274C31|nr:hypothetical protein [Amycolatopsis circi]
MKQRPAAVEQSLQKLQQLMREQPARHAEDIVAMSWYAPQAGPSEKRLVTFSEAQIRGVDEATAALHSDPRFQHVSDPRGEVMQFARECSVDRPHRHVARFVKAHARELITRICFIPIEYLTVGTTMDVLGVWLLPVDDAQIPRNDQFFPLPAAVGAIAALEVHGTDLQRMAEAANDTDTNMLRILRAGLHNQLNPSQRRFRTATVYAFDRDYF